MNKSFITTPVLYNAIYNYTHKTEYNLPFNFWIILESFSVFFIIISLYILAMLARYTWVRNLKKDLFRHRSESNYSDCNVPSTRAGLERNRSCSSFQEKDRINIARRSDVLLQILCLLGSFFALLRVFSDQLELATYGGTRVNCKAYQVAVVITYGLSATFLYVALWIRLRSFYAHPIMSNLTSSSMTFPIWFALSCILCSSILNTVIFLVTVTSIDSEYGCILGETTSISPITRYLILALSTFASQSVLLSLFLYPLLKHRSNVKSLENRSRNQLSFKRKKKKEHKKKYLLAVIWRVLITAIVCVISDVTASVITIALGVYPRIVTNLVFNFNLIVNIVSVLLSFGDWRERLLPCSTNFKKKANGRLHRKLGGTFIYQLQDFSIRRSKRSNWRNVADSCLSNGIEPTTLSGQHNFDGNDDVFEEEVTSKS